MGIDPIKQSRVLKRDKVDHPIHAEMKIEEREDVKSGVALAPTNRKRLKRLPSEDNNEMSEDL